MREQALKAIYERLNGLKYIDSKIITYYGKPFLKIGSKIRIMLDESNYIDTYNLKHNFAFDGTFSSTIESPALTKQEIKTKQNITLGQALKNTEIAVNKQDQKIISLVAEVDKHQNKLTNIEQSVDSVSQTVEQNLVFTRENTNLNQIYITEAEEDNAIVFKFFGNLDYIPTILYPRTNLYPSKTLYPNGGDI